MTPEYPTKVKVSNNEKFVYICESYLGSDENGFLDVFSIETFNHVARVEVGTSPIDLYEDEEYIYITNFTEGSISIINKKRYYLSAVWEEEEWKRSPIFFRYSKSKKKNM